MQRTLSDFKKAFGTHFVKIITIGGIYRSEFSLESSILNTTVDTDFNIKQAAEFKFTLLAEDNNYAAVKRQVSPLFELFDKQYLQASFNEQFWNDYGVKLSDAVKNVTLTFYEYNAHRGCLNINSEHFNPYANLHDENACNTVAHKYRFGGLFTGKCRKIKNVLGGDHSCISNYSQHAVFQNVNPKFNLYFCYSSEPFSAHQTQHVYFGGIYTDVFKNPVTKDYSCPSGYDIIKPLVIFKSDS
ncbi:unnamed protein product [Didymodactylos carnosus]|uniref:Uncharacterized protein n=1 Tax=Didymodactylos carnosus TaxID=1234261 RepID=A0A814U9N4_9BILA|nr:unnamed protein product [Didymodactylos carnosus]CAF3935842.1 unnamed protein product [Didymodactylos carnosus]